MIEKKYKLCTECNELINLNLFTPKNAKCKPCLNKLWKIWFNNNKEKALISKKEWEVKNIEKRRLTRNKYNKERKKNDSLYKMKCNLRTLMNSSFKNKGYTKKSKVLNILGCEFDFFKLHIENKFSDKMNWDNIHIDHIKPLYLANTEEEVILFNHYTNLQPLLAIDNLKKGKKWT